VLFHLNRPTTRSRPMRLWL